MGYDDVFFKEEHKLLRDHMTKCGKFLVGSFGLFGEFFVGTHSRSGGFCISMAL